MSNEKELSNEEAELRYEGSIQGLKWRENPDETL